MNNGIINLNTKRAKIFGFTSNKYDGYLWKVKNSIYISFIVSRHQGKGNVRKLFETILKKGFDIWVPTPSARMRMICEKFGGKSEWMDSEIEAYEGMKIQGKDK